MPPVEYIKPSQDPADNRGIMIRAAQAYDEAKRERDELKQQLDQALLGLDAKNNHIMQLEVQLAEERNRTQMYQLERDEAVEERLRVQAHLSNIKAILQDADLPPPPSKRRRKSYGDLGRPVVDPTNGGGEAVPEQTASPASVTEVHE